MKKNKIVDERIEMITNKIYKEAFFILAALLLVAICYKAYIKSMALETYLSEVCILLVTVIYIAVREMMNGNGLISISKSGKFCSLSAVLLISCVITIITGIRNYSQYADKYNGILDIHFIAVLFVCFLSSFIFLSAFYYFFYKLHQKGKQKMDKYIDDVDE